MSAEGTLGSRIRKKRKSLGLSQEQMAIRCYIPKPTISSYENDRVDIKSSVILELARVLNTDANYLLHGIEKERTEKEKNPLIIETISLIKEITDPKMLEVLIIQIRAMVIECHSRKSCPG